MQKPPELTTLRVLGYDLTGKGRPDGSIYYTCGALPGFHYILEPGHAGISLTLAPALSQFLSDQPSYTTEQGRLAYPYDEDCYCPDGPPGSEPGWWCPFGHEIYRDDCWGCRY